jgi:hypothetical protein
MDTMVAIAKPILMPRFDCFFVMSFQEFARQCNCLCRLNQPVPAQQAFEHGELTRGGLENL